MLPHSSHLFVGQWRNRAARAHQRPSAALTVMDFEWEQNWELGKIAGNSGKQFWERLATSQTTGCSVSPCPQASESTFRTSLCHVSAATVWYIWYCLCVPLALCLSKISVFWCKTQGILTTSSWIHMSADCIVTSCQDQGNVRLILWNASYVYWRASPSDSDSNAELPTGASQQLSQPSWPVLAMFCFFLSFDSFLFLSVINLSKLSLFFCIVFDLYRK